MEKTITRFPWLGMLSSSAFIILLLVLSEPDLSVYLPAIISELLNLSYIKILLLALVLACFISDYFRCKQSGAEFDERLRSQNAQLDELFRSKYALQNKAHRYSGHADKLKLFISDKLLEYIEYDEKFLHFKNIASEVRHNGVISYDRVTSLLQNALEHDLPVEEKRQYQNALNSMIYLWDLLDLSTTDNIAMYIADKLYESEELYYRSVLDKTDSPFTPTFSVRQSILKTLSGFIEDRDALEVDLQESVVYNYEDAQYRIHLQDVGEFLGNENYIVLLMENIINNGLYYAEQRKYKNQYAKLALTLSQENKVAVIRAYNPGPEIADDLRDKIYQLGFSSKRGGKSNQGKGLGLYFVKQIVNGYEGSIDFVNVRNREEKYVIRIECESGAIVNEIIETVVSPKGKLSCKNDDDTILKTFKFKVGERIRNIEVSPHATRSTQVFDKFDPAGESTFVDPDNKDRPTWCLDVKQKPASTEIVFRPLDTIGVEFIIKIPTVEARLDADYHDADEQDDDSESTSDIDQLPDF